MLKLQPNMMTKVQTLAIEKKMSLEAVVEEALQQYMESQCIRLLEKQLPNGTYRVITLHSYGICVEHISKRINIDGFKDMDTLLDDGYYPIAIKELI